MQEIFDESQRKQSKKIVFLVTDGFSNGRNPKPIAEEIKTNNITIFTLGINSGNLDELRSICSKPIESYNYLLKSFSLFESLARKALHTDYKVGVILPVGTDVMCDALCDKNNTKESCCDPNSQCACGFHSGHYSCICNPGKLILHFDNSKLLTVIVCFCKDTMVVAYEALVVVNFVRMEHTGTLGTHASTVLI